MAQVLFDRRTLVTAASLSCLAACAGPPAIPAAVNAPPFTLEGFFTRTTIGRGGFVSAIAGVNRQMVVKTTGRWDGKTLVLREDFVFADGEKDTKTWRFTRIAQGVYEGTREDVVGKAVVRQVGNTVQLTYSADVTSKDGSVTRLDFADTIAPLDRARVLNKAIVSKFGVPVGEISLIFARSS
jgi:Protein of unknown function (DUF3833)